MKYFEDGCSWDDEVKPTTSSAIKTAKHLFGYVSRIGILSDIYNQAKDIISSKTFYVVDITSIRERFTMEFLSSVFKNLPHVLDGSDHGIQDRADGYYYDTIKYRGCRIVIRLSKCCPSAQLITLNTENSRKTLNEFAKSLNKKAEKSLYNNDFGWVSLDEYGTLRPHVGRSKRTLNDVFIPKDAKDDILNTFLEFKKNREWYAKHFIPYHFGLMLYGPPGTGKSSFISALANHFGLVPHYVSVQNMRDMVHSAEKFRERFAATDDIKLLVLEDVDSLDFVCKEKGLSDIRDDMAKAELELRSGRDKQLLSDFLNMIDGAKCIENVFWIMTTNHVDKINPAVLRPGRIDKSICIDYVCPDTMKEFIKYHFDKDVDVSAVRENISFAEIQTDVMCGMSVEDILNKYTISP